MNRAPFLALSAAAALALSGCSSSSYTPPPPPERDEAAASALPGGSYTVTGVTTLGGEELMGLVGYVDFGTEIDGVDCASDYTVTNSGAGSVVRAVRPARGEYYTRYLEGADSPSGSSEWRTGVEAAPTLTMFTPAQVLHFAEGGVSAGAGAGNLCTIPAMPRFMNFADGVFTTDPVRTQEALEAVAGNYAAKWLSGDAARDAAELAVIDFDLGSEIFTVEVALAENPDGGFTLTQTWPSNPDEDNVVLVFTPAPKRTITAPSA